MKYTKSIIAMLVVMAAAIFSSCNQENLGAIYNPTQQNVSFENEGPGQLLTADPTASTVVRVTRAISAGEYTAHYTVKASQDGIFSDSGNGSVTFADGQSVANIQVDAKNMTPGTLYEYTMTFDDAVAEAVDTITNTAILETTISIMCDYEWEYAGHGTFTDLTWFEGAPTADVKIMHAVGTNIYRLVNALASVDATMDEPDGLEEVNIDFVLNEDGTVVMEDGVYDMGCAPYMLYFDTENYPDYCYITNEDGYLSFNFLLLNGSNLYIGGFDFDWKEGYPIK